MSREIGVSAWKDVGVDLRGYVNLSAQASLTFDLYSVNGLGSGSNLRGSRQYRDNNEDKAFGGRANLIFLDVLEIGSSAYRGAWDDAGDHDLTMIGAHLLAQTPVVEVYGQYARATSQNPAPADGGDMSEFFVQASRLVGSRFRSTIQYGELDYLDEGDTLGRSASKGGRDLREVPLAVACYPHPKVAFKAEYTVFTEGGRVQSEANNQFGLKAAVRF